LSIMSPRSLFNNLVDPCPSDQSMTLPAAGAGDKYRSIVAVRTRAAENLLHAAVDVDRRNRQTDGQTDTVPLHGRFVCTRSGQL